MTKRSIVFITGLIALLAFVGGAFLYERLENKPLTPEIADQGSSLIRAYSPIIGPVDAPVTIVEFFDPSCEACRAFYPVVKQILATFPNDTRLVIRYAPLHDGSDEAVRILETARLQDRFVPVLEALLAQQPAWAVHGSPDLNKAWQFAGMAGLDVEQARRDMNAPAITKTLEQDVADVAANNIRQTPSFFVNGKPLQSFGPQELFELVKSEVELSKKQ